MNAHTHTFKFLFVCAPFDFVICRMIFGNVIKQERDTGKEIKGQREIEKEKNPKSITGYSMAFESNQLYRNGLDDNFY